MLNDNNIQTTQIVFAEEARKQLYEGLRLCAEAVTATLGPKGKTVLIQKSEGMPVITKDGISVAKAINLRDPMHRMGAQLICDAALQTNEVAGDGTTTATVLTHAMVKEGLKLIESGYSAVDLCKGIEIATAAIVDVLKKNSKQLTTTQEIAQIATISANGDKNIGDLIAEAMSKVGRDGIISVEDAKGMTTNMHIVEGMQFDRGYLSPYFVTNNEKMHAAYNDAKVLVTDKKISSLKEIVPVLEKLINSPERPALLIIADDVDGEAMQGLVLNKLKSGLKVVAIKAPGFGTHRTELLNDIATLTGAKLVSSSNGFKLEDVTLADLGSLKKVVVDAKTSTLVATGTTKDAVEEHLKNLRTQLEDITLDAEGVTKLKVRIAKLASGVAVIRVGGSTEIEMVERKYRIEDALNATRAATEEGIVPGGGIALLTSRQQCNVVNDNMNDDVKKGIDIIFKACLAPITKIVTNAGTSAEVVLSELLKNPGLGYNAGDGTYVDMIKAGVIDPVKVTRVALQNAASVAKTFLTLDAAIVEEKPKE